MAQDILYYFDQNNSYERKELGEIQVDFNMSIVIDGTKDSMQVDIFNFLDKPIKPNTIVYHNATQTWWVVRKDKVKRYANEIDYMYKHQLTLNGAIDLLGSRDLTDSGFNDNTYTIDQFIKRLFKHSNFEFNVNIVYGNNVDKDRVVDYIKTYENYTPLSALRDFLGGYNCDAKMSFTTTTISNKVYLDSANLLIIPKTGNIDLEEIDIDDFDDVRESKDIDKESFGTTVISNAQNVVSTMAKTYPQVGSKRLQANARTISRTNAYLQLPTPIFKVNWLKILTPTTLFMEVQTSSTATHDNTFYFGDGEDSVELQFMKWAETIANNSGYDSEYLNGFWELINGCKDEIIDTLQKASTTTCYTGWKWNPDLNNPKFIAPENNDEFYFPRVNQFENINATELVDATLVIGEKAEQDTITVKNRCMWYERGGTTINNFAWLGSTGALHFIQNTYFTTTITSYRFTDLRSASYNNSAIFYTKTYTINPNKTITIRFYLEPLPYTNQNYRLYDPFKTSFIVNYIPMSDIKAKLDNKNETYDSKLYNQNGKLNDSVAFSKLLDTYSKDIQSETLTRYMHYTNFSDIPQIGQLVKYGTYKYVINNISYDFVANEEKTLNKVSYFIECEFTLAPYVSTKSIMVNPNSNIRDYGIPQNHNVKRRQVYRDYFEFSLESDENANQETPYNTLNNYISTDFNEIVNEYNHTAVIKVVYDKPTGGGFVWDTIPPTYSQGSDKWYYQLDTTTYVMNKSIYEIVDFNDNNIIGYDMQNKSSGFQMSRIGNPNWVSINTPISYVDDDGKLRDIFLAMVNKERLTNLYQQIKADSSLSGASYLSTHCFVGKEVYEGKYNETQSQVIFQKIWNTDANSNAHVLYQYLKPSNYVGGSGSINDILVFYNGSQINDADIIYQSVQETQDYVNVIVDLSLPSYANLSGIINIIFDYAIGTQIYAGAKDIADYVLEEINYNKDAIEVPVFEYIMQLNGTESVEIGDNALDRNDALLVYYSIGIFDKNTRTLLNTPIVDNLLIDENAYISGLEWIGTFYNTNGCKLTFNNDGTELRIRAYQGYEINAWLNNGTPTSLSVASYVTPYTKADLKNKDIVVYRTIISKFVIDESNETMTTTKKNDILAIIHGPKESNLEHWVDGYLSGEDIVIKLNYYKLK